MGYSVDITPFKAEPIDVLSRAGSGSGSKGITSVMRCLRGCAAEVEFERHYPNEGRLRNDARVLKGTIVHRRLEAYYSGRPLVEEVIPLEEAEVLDLQADQIYQAYIARFPRNEFGKPCEVEVTHPQSERERAALNKHIYEGYSCKFDLVIRPPRTVCNKLLEQGLLLSPNCYYIVDHKVMGGFYPQWGEMYTNSIQMHTYIMAFCALYPRRWLGGVIVNAIGASRKGEVRRLLIEPDLEMEPVCRAAWIEGLSRMHAAQPNPEHCFFPSVCPFLGGRCNRVALDMEEC